MPKGGGTASKGLDKMMPNLVTVNAHRVRKIYLKSDRLSYGETLVIFQPAMLEFQSVILVGHLVGRFFFFYFSDISQKEILQPVVKKGGGFTTNFFHDSIEESMKNQLQCPRSQVWKIVFLVDTDISNPRFMSHV